MCEVHLPSGDILSTPRASLLMASDISIPLVMVSNNAEGLVPNGLMTLSSTHTRILALRADLALEAPEVDLSKKDPGSRNVDLPNVDHGIRSQSDSRFRGGLSPPSLRPEAGLSNRHEAGLSGRPQAGISNRHEAGPFMCPEAGPSRSPEAGASVVVLQLLAFSSKRSFPSLFLSSLKLRDTKVYAP